MSKRDETLGIPYGTAMNQLRRKIMFNLLCKLNLNSCFRCSKEMTVEDYTIEHKEPWRSKDAELFWDLENISFSHKSCNSGSKRHVNRYGPQIERPPGYNYCTECKTLKLDSEFWKNKNSCKKCRNKRNNEWRYRKGLRGKAGRNGNRTCLENRGLSES